MPEMKAIFDDYALAMDRKLQIARWHAEHLPELVGQPPDPFDLPPIELQAHFEGAGRSLASIPDQLASGISEVLQEKLPGLPKPSRSYLHTVVNRLPDDSDLRKMLGTIVVDHRYCDLRSWRNRATHRFDRKAMLDKMWEVEYPEGCENPVTQRDLTTYVDIMIGFAEEILGQTPAVRQLALKLVS